MTDIFDRTIKTILFGKTEHAAEISGEWKTPPASKLFNFWVKDYLVLDNYGNEMLPKPIHERFFGSKDYNLAISKNGDMFIATFEEVEGHLTMYLNYLFEFPKAMLDRIEELLTSKRPFLIGIDEPTWREFHLREIGYSDMQKSLYVQINFHDISLQINESHWREVSCWVAKEKETSYCDLRNVHNMLAVAVRTLANNEFKVNDESIDAYHLCSRICDIGDRLTELNALEDEVDKRSREGYFF